MVEMVVDRSMDRNEFLQTSRLPKPQHSPLSSSKRKMRILSAIVQSTSHHLTPGIAIPLHCFLEEFQFCSAIAAFGDEAL